MTPAHIRRLLVAGSVIAVLAGCGSRTGLGGFGGAGPNPGTGGTSTGGAGGGPGGIFGGGGVLASGGSLATGGLIGSGGFASGGAASGGTASGGSASGGTGGTPPLTASLDYFKSPGPNLDELFGAAVALSADGRTLAIGAPFDGSAAIGINGDPLNDDLHGSGAVFVYFRQDDTWALQAFIKASNPDVADEFGWVLDLSASGDRLVVGASGEGSAALGIDGDQSNNDAARSGAVYVFSRVGSTWSQDAYVKATNSETSDGFGCAVALSGDGSTLAVGAYGESSAASGVQGDQTDNTELSAGAVYVLADTGAGWHHQAYLKASNTESFDIFGLAVALAGDGNTLVVGAPYEGSSATGVDGIQDDEGALSSGAAYVFERSGSTWSQTSYVKASNTDQGDLFGSAVDISNSGNSIAVGAINERSGASGVNGDQSDNDGGVAGAVYVLERAGQAWTHAAYIKASNPHNANFGSALAFSGNESALLVGALGEASAATGINGDQSDQSMTGAGAAYLFRRTPPTWQQTAYLKAHNPASYANFARTVALDQSAHVAAMGSPHEDGSSPGINGNPNDQTTSGAGAAYVYTFD